MLQIKASKFTYLKSKPIQSTELHKHEKYALNPGDSLEVKDIVPTDNQHIELILNNRVSISKNSYNSLYAYSPHILIISDMSNEVMLEVPYYSQLDNSTHLFGPGSRQCNISSCSMYAAYLNKESVRKSKELGYNTFEDYYSDILSEYGDTTNHSAHTKALRQLNIETYFSYSLSLGDIIKAIKINIPVVLGLAYKNSGHIVVATGYDLTKERLYIHDPYGIRFGGSDSYEVGVPGNFDPYSFEQLKHIWTDLGDDAGWGRICTSVYSKPTGLS